MDDKRDKQPDDFVEDDQPWRPADEDDNVEAETLATPAAAEADHQAELPETTPAAEDETPADAALAEADNAATTEAAAPEDGAEPPDDDDENETAADEPPAASDGDAAAAVDADVADAAEIDTAAVIEAVLFSADEPVTPQKLVAIVGAGDVKTVRRHVAELNQKYEQTHCAFRIEAIAGGYQMLTLPRFDPWLRKLLKVRGETKLSPAALETLAIIAYKQPILRVDVEAIRGVAAGEMIRQLIEKGLVKIVGRAEIIGRPLLYGTTRKFLEVFGLNSLKDLPTAAELKQPD